MEHLGGPMGVTPSMEIHVITLENDVPFLICRRLVQRLVSELRR